MNTLVIDVGTTVMKQYLFDENAECLWQAERRFELQRNGERVEGDPLRSRDDLLSLLTEVGVFCREQDVRVDAIALTSQRSSVMPLDEHDRPLAPMMMWQDRRADSVCRAIETHVEEIRRICGMLPTSVYSAPKIAWIRRNRPEIYTQTRRFMGFYEWLMLALTGRAVTDDSVAARSCLCDVASGEWSPRLLELFGVERDTLCKLLPVGSVLPAIAKIARLLGQSEPPIVVMAGGDQQCAAVGAGCLKAGDLQINVGTGGYVLGVLDASRPRENPQVRYNRSSLPPLLLAEGSVTQCCTAVDRLTRLLYEDASIERFAADAAAAPLSDWALNPERIGDHSQCDDESLCRELSALAESKGKPAVSAALLEGIAQALADCARQVATACGDAPPARIVCGGGLMRSEAFCRKLANRLGAEVAVPSFGNSTAFGAWVVARQALGQERYDAAWQRAHSTMTIWR